MMINQNDYSQLRIQGKIIFIALVGLMVTMFCDIPIFPAREPDVDVGPFSWQSDLDNKKFEEIIEETRMYIEAGEESKFYAEARLFRGLSKLYLKDLEGAQEDLSIAEVLKADLTTIDLTEEHVLLFRGLMVLYIQLEEVDRAEFYLDQALALAPEQREEILVEYNNALQP